LVLVDILVLIDVDRVVLVVHLLMTDMVPEVHLPWIGLVGDLVVLDLEDQEVLVVREALVVIGVQVVQEVLALEALVPVVDVNS
jgi:hypothetical protein